MPQYCLVKHRISTYVIDGADADRNPDRVPVTGVVTFEALLDKGDSVVVTEGAEATTITLAAIEARITNGEIYHRGEEGVKLFAGGPDANPERIRYRAKFENLIAGGKRIELKDILFEAIPGGELTLSMVQPVPGAPYPGYSATIEQGITQIADTAVSYLDQIEGARDEALEQVSGAVGAEVGGYLQAISGPNLLNLDGALPGKSINTAGEVIDNPSRTATDFIPVEPSTQYVWSHDGTPLDASAVIFQAYAADKTMIGGQIVAASFTTTSTTRFIRASILNDVIDKAQLEKGTTPTPYVTYGGLRATDVTLPEVGSVKSRLDSVDQSATELAGRMEAVETLAGETADLIQESKNLLNLEGSHPGKSWDTNENLTTNPTRTATDYLPVEGSTQYVWSHDGTPLPQDAAIYQAYSADKVPIGGRRTLASFTTTSTTRFIRVSILNEFIDKAQLEKGTDPTPYIAYGGVSIPGLAVGTDPSLSATLTDLRNRVSALEDPSLSATLTDLMNRVSALEGAPPAPTPGGGTTPQSLLSWEPLPHQGRMIATAYDGNMYFDSRVDGNTRMVKSTDSGTTITSGLRTSDTPGGSNGIIETIVWEDGSVVRIGWDGRIYRADAFDATPTLVYQTTTGNTLHAIANSSYSDGAGKRYIFAGEYDHTSAQKSMFYSRDGGDTWDVLLQGGTLNSGNNHWHSVAYDPYRDAVWVSEGDGDNSKVGVTFDWGLSWEWIPQNHPTALYAFPDRVVMGRDKSGIPPGISQSDGTAPITITDALTFRAEDRGSFHFYPLRPSWNQWNDTYYILFPARHEDDTDSYIWATGDGGESWHLVSNGPVPQLNLAGVDSHGYLFAGTGGAVDSPLYRAKAVTWL